MNFNDHSHLEGRHAFLSASKHSWTNYDLEKLDLTYRTSQAAAYGTRLHEYAKEAIELGIKQADTDKTINQYINDAIGFRMKPEQILYFSPICFGTVDAISFRDGLLRIHDLKTGVSKASFRQLEIYVALFCLEYLVKPGEIDIVLRIYQNDTFEEYVPELDDIARIMDKIITFVRHIENIQKELQ